MRHSDIASIERERDPERRTILSKDPVNWILRFAAAAVEMKVRFRIPPWQLLTSPVDAVETMVNPEISTLIDIPFGEAVPDGETDIASQFMRLKRILTLMGI